MKKKFNVFLYPGSNLSAERAVIVAALINGGDYKNLGLDEIVAQSDGVKEGDTTICKIDDTLLHIDRNIGGEWKTVCRIECVEVFELASNGMGALAE